MQISGAIYNTKMFISWYTVQYEFVNIFTIQVIQSINKYFIMECSNANSLDCTILKNLTITSYYIMLCSFIYYITGHFQKVL